jgi:hypothetical protein
MAKHDRPIPTPDDELLEIYQELKTGRGHHRVNDGNVFQLAAIAARYGDKLIEQMLLEWQAPCSDGSNGVPSTFPPARGFNRDHTKH